MNIKTLKAIIANLPDDMDLMLKVDGSYFTYEPVESVSVKSVPFVEDPSDEVTDETPVVDCLVFEEE